MSSSDVAVVGAGPAGAWAAYTLARRGARVTIFDASHPREKPCGGGVTGRALALVADALAEPMLPRRTIRSARFVDSHRGGTAVVSLDDAPAEDSSLIVASRAAFDAALLDAAQRAGAVLQRARVVDVGVTADGARIHTAGGTYSAAVVIGADGANSLVRRRVSRPFPREQLSIATGFFAHGPTSLSTGSGSPQATSRDDEVVIEFVADPAGYLWSFPRPDHLAIGICAQADSGLTPAALRDRAHAWVRRTRLAEGARLEQYSWPIPSLDARAFGALALADERWAVAGDAAGLVDPITREGIYFAILSGQWAADAVASGRFPRDYASQVCDEIASDLACAARLKAGFFRPAFMGLLIQALQESAAVRGIMVDLVAGRQSYATLKWRLLQTLEFRLAWKTLVGVAQRG